MVKTFLKNSDKKKIESNYKTRNHLLFNSGKKVVELD